MKTLLSILMVLALPAFGGREFVAASSQYFTNAVPLTSAVPLTLVASVWSKDVANTTVALQARTSTNTWRHEILSAGAIAGDPFYGRTFTTSGAQASGGAINTNAWQHLSAVFEASNLRTLYVDGVPVATNSNTRSFPNVDIIVVGASTASGAASFFTGTLGEAMVWSAALRADEILSLSLGCSPFLIRPGLLIFYAPLSGNDPEPNLVGTPLAAVNAPALSSNHPRIYRP